MRFVIAADSTARIGSHGWLVTALARAERGAASAGELLRAWVESPLFVRSFCAADDRFGQASVATPPLAHHGPLLAQDVAPERLAAAFEPCSAADAMAALDRALETELFDEEPPDAAARAAVARFTRAARPAATEWFLFRPDAARHPLVEFHWIWTPFVEALAIDAARGEIAIGVLGLD